MFRFATITSENILVFVVKYKKRLIYSALLFFILLFCVFSYIFVQNKKKSEISATIAIGLANLAEMHEAESLHYLEKAFNNSSGIYRLIAGAGILKILKDKEKSLNVLNLLESQKIDKTFKPILDTVYFGMLAESKSKELINHKSFQKFVKDVKGGKNYILKEQLAQIFLHIKEKKSFNDTISGIEIEAEGSAQSFQSEYSFKNRMHLFKNLS